MMNCYVNLNTAGVHELAPVEAGKRIGVRSFCLTTQCMPVKFGSGSSPVCDWPIGGISTSTDSIPDAIDGYHFQTADDSAPLTLHVPDNKGVTGWVTVEYFDA